MGYVTLGVLYDEARQMRKEIQELRTVLIPEERMPAEERRELNAVFAEMRKGKEKNWREILKA